VTKGWVRLRGGINEGAVFSLCPLLIPYRTPDRLLRSALTYPGHADRYLICPPDGSFFSGSIDFARERLFSFVAKQIGPLDRDIGG
jgi:hypothetical protein